MSYRRLRKEFGDLQIGRSSQPRISKIVGRNNSSASFGSVKVSGDLMPQPLLLLVLEQAGCVEEKLVAVSSEVFHYGEQGLEERCFLVAERMIGHTLQISIGNARERIADLFFFEFDHLGEILEGHGLTGPLR